ARTMRSAEVARAGRRAREAGTSAWTALARNRRCPPGVVKVEISPLSAQRRRVFGVTPRVRLASPRVSQRFPSFLAKPSQIYHRPVPRRDLGDDVADDQRRGRP